MIKFYNCTWALGTVQQVLHGYWWEATDRGSGYYWVGLIPWLMALLLYYCMRQEGGIRFTFEMYGEIDVPISLQSLDASMIIEINTKKLLVWNSNIRIDIKFKSLVTHNTNVWISVGVFSAKRGFCTYTHSIVQFIITNATLHRLFEGCVQTLNGALYGVFAKGVTVSRRVGNEPLDDWIQFFKSFHKINQIVDSILQVSSLLF